MSQALKQWAAQVMAEDPHDLQGMDEITPEDDWGEVNLQVEDVDIVYQNDDGNSDCGDSCTI